MKCLNDLNANPVFPFCFRNNSIMFMTPGLPFVPAIAVTVNIYLIFKLSILTLVRFTVWMILGINSYIPVKYKALHNKLSTEQRYL